MTYRTLLVPTVSMFPARARQFGMATQAVTPEYMVALEAFQTRLSASSVIPAAYPTAFAISVHIDAGRKFDRVLVGFAYMTAQGTVEHTPLEVWYFVNRFDGTIYGKKSEVAPNLRWWFGTIFTTQEWEWTERVAHPRHPEQFAKVGQYGKFTHYQPLTH